MTSIPHDGASGEATEGRTERALDMTGRGQEDTTERRTMTGDVDVQPQVMDGTETDSSSGTNKESITGDVNAVITRARQKQADNAADAQNSEEEIYTWQQMCGIDVADVDALDSKKTWIANEQQADETLAPLIARAKRGDKTFQIIDGVLYKISHQNTDPEYRGELVVPKKLRIQVLNTAHDHVMSSHSGISRTLNRIRGIFYWPKYGRDVALHIRSCRPCQLVARRNIDERQPLQPIPVITSQPFDSVSIDIIGELPRTATNKRYILTILCNNSHWLEAVPLSNMNGSTICDALMSIFTRFGLPREIRLDNQSSFHSQLFTAVRDKLQIKANFSCVYHPISHGAIEKANGDLEAMLKKYIDSQNATQWDKFIPYLLMAQHEAFCHAIGCSPAELLFGRKLTGPIRILRSLWTDDDRRPRQKSVSQYLDELKSRLQLAAETAQAVADKNKITMKRFYDRHSKPRSLKIGDKVLVFLPTSSSKIKAKLSGPFSVVEVLANNNYKLDFGGRQGVLHINQLRKFVERENEGPPQTVAAIITTDDGDDQFSPPTLEWTDNADDKPRIGEHLTNSQRRQVEAILEKHAESFTRVPGTTHLMQAEIKLKSDIPVHQREYRVPYALQEEVEQELLRMWNHGVIEPCTSEYSSPMVIVRKPDKTVRICCNYIQLNKLVQNDEYPMPCH